MEGRRLRWRLSHSLVSTPSSRPAITIYTCILRELAAYLLYPFSPARSFPVCLPPSSESNNSSHVCHRPDLTFYVDREEVGSYRKPNPPGFGFIYDHLVFSTDSLSNTTHTLTIQNGRSGGVASTVLLDYIVYL